VWVGLHHHGEQRPVDPAAAFDHRGEEGSGLQLRDTQIQIACAVVRVLGRCPLRWLMRVAVRSPRAGADDRGGLGLDQLLQERFGQ
jgi:hypothetical protein